MHAHTHARTHARTDTRETDRSSSQCSQPKSKQSIEVAPTVGFSVEEFQKGWVALSWRPRRDTCDAYGKARVIHGRHYQYGAHLVRDMHLIDTMIWHACVASHARVASSTLFIMLLVARSFDALDESHGGFQDGLRINTC